MASVQDAELFDHNPEKIFRLITIMTAAQAQRNHVENAFGDFFAGDAINFSGLLTTIPNDYVNWLTILKNREQTGRKHGTYRSHR